MKSQSFKYWAEKLELWLIGLLALYLFGLNVPPTLVKVMQVASYGIITLVIIRRWKRFIYVATRDIYLLLLVGMVMASVFWSASPEVTSNETKALLRTTLLGVCLATRFSIKEQMQLLAWVLGIGIVLSFVFALGMPSYGIHTDGEMVGAWKGIFTFKNLFASIMTIAAILFLMIALNSLKKRWLSWMLFTLAVLLLVLSQGKTAYSVLFISLCLLPLHKFVKQQYKLRLVLIITAFLLSGSLIVLILNNIEFIVVDTLGKDMSGSGRMPIWNLALEKALERPWIGYGFSGFWTSDEALYVLHNSWAELSLESGTRFNAHNGYLDLFLALGSIGVFVYLLGFMNLFVRTLNLWITTKRVEYFWVIQSLVAIFLLNFSDSLGLVSTNTLWSLYVSFSLSTAVKQTRLIKKET